MKHLFATFLISVSVLSISLAQNTSEQLKNFPKDADPVMIGNKIANRFLEQPHSMFGNPLRYNEPITQITYPDVCLWLGALWFADKSKNDALYTKLENRFAPLLDKEAKLQPNPNHVDNNVFGALPLELYKRNKNQKYLDLGLLYANTQWTLPKEGFTPQQKKWSDRGYAWQTRIWIDDMYMITTVQAQAYRVTKDTAYINRAAREMALYIDSIQLKNGVFYHAPSAPFCWSRGNGWMAVGMTEMLRILPTNHPYRPKLLECYRKMMKTLKSFQDENGMWHQLIDDKDMWVETSATAMFTYAMINGVKNKWLDEKEYGPVARKGWLGLVKYIDAKGDIKNVCEGTDIGNTKEHYRNRMPVTGDGHGQAPVMWCAFALLN